MVNKLVNLLKLNPFYIPGLLLKNYRNFKITDSEFVILIYIINASEKFNPKQIADDLNFKLGEVLELVNSLVEKGILKIDIVNNKVREEYINLEGLYTKLAYLIVNEEEVKDTTIFELIENEFGRSLSPMDYEIISEWQKQYSDKLITLALKEATYNNVKNLRYIDKILDDWYKKGIKTEEDILNDKKKFETKKSKPLFDYDWINERDS